MKYVVFLKYALQQNHSTPYILLESVHPMSILSNENTFYFVLLFIVIHYSLNGWISTHGKK